MWRRWRGRSLAPRRPAVFSEQWPLVILTAAAVIAGIVVVVVILSR